MKKRKKSIRPLLVVAALVAAAVVWYATGASGLAGGEEEASLPGAEVRQGPLRISVVQRGNLEAKDSIKLRSQIEGRATILYLIPEGTTVQEGELLAELDASDLQDRRVGQEITVENARSERTKAEQNLAIQESQNASDLARASQNLEFSHTDLKKYLEGDWPRQLQEAEEAIILAQEQQAQDKDRLEWSKRLEKDGFLTRTELEKDELTYQRSVILLEQARRRKKLLQEFDHPKESAKLQAAVEEAVREKERVELQARARIVDYEAAVKTSTSRLQLEEEKLAKFNKQINNARIFAPASGMVVYGREDGGRWGQGDPIQEGTEVRERQEIVTIPREQGMIVEASLHESVLKKVQVGLPCVVMVDALPDQEFNGTVNFVAHLPDSGSWWANPNQRLYKTEIAISNPSVEMRPGMSCGVEIVIAEFEDATFVPVQAVFFHKGHTICFVDEGGSPAERAVETGLSSEKWVEVRSGLAAGEIVYLSPPQGFVPEAAEEKAVVPARSGMVAGQQGQAAASGAVPAGGSREERPATGAQPGGAGAGAAAQWGSMTAEQREEMRKRFEAMTPEQKEELRKRFMGGSDGGGRPPGTSGPSADK